MPLAAVVAVVVIVALLAGWVLFGGDEPAAKGPGRATSTTPDGKAPVDLRPGGATLTPPGGPTTPSTGGADGPAGTSPVAVDPLAAPRARGLRGRVVDTGGRPIQGAEVLAAGVRGESVGERIALTGADGRFAIAGRLPTPLVEVAAARFARRVVALQDEPDLGDVVLVPARRVRGRVVAAEDGRAIEQATVEAESASWRGRTRSDASGAFGFEDAPAGESINVLASAEGRVNGTGAPGGEDEVVLRLERGRAVRGVVLWSDGTPAEGALVWVVGADQLASPQLTTSGPGGRFEVWGISPPEGLAVLAAGRSATRVESTPVDLAWLDAGADEVPVQLFAPRRVRVLAPWARLAPGRLILRPVSCPPGVTLGADTVATAEGQELAIGAWQLWLDERPIGEPILVSPDPAPLDAPWPAEAEVEPPAWVARPLHVRVTDEVGRPLAGAQVLLAQSGRDGREVTRVTGDDGRARFEERPPRAFVVSASTPGRLLVAPAVFDDEGRPAGDARPADVDLVLAVAVTLEGVIVRPPGTSGAVLVSVMKDGAIVARGWGDQGGRFSIRDLPPGRTTLEVAGDGCTPLTLEVDLPAAGPLRVTLEPSGEEHEHGEGEPGHEEHAPPPPRPGRG